MAGFARPMTLTVVELIARYLDHAQLYYRICMSENSVVARVYEGRISFTYNGPEYKALLPDLPLVCWHSRKRGVAHKPWALEEVGEEDS